MNDEKTTPPVSPFQDVIDPLALRYKGRPLFVPAHMLREGLMASDDPFLNHLGTIQTKDHPVWCVPNNTIMTEMCKAGAPKLSLEPNREKDFDFYEPKIDIRELPDPHPEERYQTPDDGTSNPQYILNTVTLEMKRMICDFEEPIFNPLFPEQEKSALKFRMQYAANRVLGVQNFSVVLPYTGFFSIPRLWHNRVDKVTAALRTELLKCYRDNYEVRLREEHRSKK